jgi:hypothetical protein
LGTIWSRQHDLGPLGFHFERVDRLMTRRDDTEHDAADRVSVIREILSFSRGRVAR